MAEKSDAVPRRIAIGVIRKAIGLKGECAVQALGTSLQKIKAPLDVFIGREENVCIPEVLEHVEFRPKGPVCSFSGVHDMEGAEALRDHLIYINLGNLPELGSDNYYHFELVGMKVQTDLGVELGSVVTVHNFPTVDSIEVDTGHPETLMIPLIADALIEIDRMSGFITVKKSYIEDLF